MLQTQNSQNKPVLANPQMRHGFPPKPSGPLSAIRFSSDPNRSMPASNLKSAVQQANQFIRFPPPQLNANNPLLQGFQSIQTNQMPPLSMPYNQPIQNQSVSFGSNPIPNPPTSVNSGIQSNRTPAFSGKQSVRQMDSSQQS